MAVVGAALLAALGLIASGEPGEAAGGHHKGRLALTGAGAPYEGRCLAAPSRRDLHVFEIAGLVVDADARRRDPARELAWLHHRLENSTYPVLKLVDGQIKRVDEPALTAVNMRLRDDYTADCQRGLDRWNKVIDKTGVAFKLQLPHVGFHRDIGEFKDVKVTPAGEIIDAAAWQRGIDGWLPSKGDGDFIVSLMQRVTEPGQFASWIAPPRIGIDNKPGDFEYVKIAA